MKKENALHADTEFVLRRSRRSALRKQRVATSSLVADAVTIASLFHDLFQLPISHHTICSVITAQLSVTIET